MIHSRWSMVLFLFFLLWSMDYRPWTFFIFFPQQWIIGHGPKKSPPF
jgi:hypothetical protein